MSTNGQNSQIALNDNIKLTNININSKFKWKTQTGKLNKKSKPISMLYPDPSYKQVHTNTQNKGLEEDLQIEWGEKKTGVVTFVSDKIDFNSNKE